MLRKAVMIILIFPMALCFILPNVQVPQKVEATATYQHNYVSGETYYIRNSKSGLYLDVASGALQTGNYVQQYPTNATLAQTWTINKLKDGSLTFSIIKDGYAYDLSVGNNILSTNCEVIIKKRKKALIQVLHPNGYCSMALVVQFRLYQKDTPTNV